MRNDSEGSYQPPPEARLLRAIAAEAIAACDPAPAVARAVPMGTERLSVAGQAIGMQRKGRLLILAYGKAAPRMLDGLLGRIAEAGGRRIVEALSIGPRPGSPRSGTTTHGTGLRRPGRVPRRGAAIRLARLRGDHPVPKAASFAAGRRALRLATSARAADDVIFLASGGGSALMAAPLEPFMTLADKTLLHRMLLVSGAPIGTINAVRKHLSAIKGGRLAVAARRARSRTTLILCDVDPERHDEVASGPSLPDRTTLDDVVMAIDRYGLAPALPFAVLDGLRRGRIPETPTPRDAIFRRSESAIVLSNRDLRNAAVRAGLSRGLSAEAVPIDLTGPVEEAMERVARAVETAPQGTRLLVLGGEVTTVPSGGGEGGRAQELALRLAIRMAWLGSRPWAFLALGSDGIDGNSPAAGAFVDRTTLERARARDLDPAKFLAASDSYGLFRRLGDHLVTGPTGTNLRDLYLLLTGDAGPVTPRPPRRPPWPAGSGS